MKRYETIRNEKKQYFLLVKSSINSWLENQLDNQNLEITHLIDYSVVFNDWQKQYSSDLNLVEVLVHTLREKFDPNTPNREIVFQAMISFSDATWATTERQFTKMIDDGFLASQRLEGHGNKNVISLTNKTLSFARDINLAMSQP